MSFRVTARTILQLGAELISTDEIAFYELIKNAIDAGSPNVEIDIVARISHDLYLAIRDELTEKKGLKKQPTAEYLDEVKERIKSQLMPGAHKADQYLGLLKEAEGIDAVIEVLDEANYIDIEDTGEGMSLNDLNDVYLTIGTRSRLVQRSRLMSSGNGQRPPLGEKGVGRLSTMRLGQRLYVKTTRKGEARWNILPIDWSRFSHDSDQLLDTISLDPQAGPPKKSKMESGTLIHLSALTSKWDSEKVQRMVSEEFSRFSDPFNPKAKYPIEIFYNDEPYVIPDFDQSIFKYAHATVNAEFTIEPFGSVSEDQALRLKGRVNYRLREMKKAFDLVGADLTSAAKVSSLQTLRLAGPVFDAGILVQQATHKSLGRHPQLSIR